MTTIINHLRSAARKRAAYHNTVQELRALPLDVALDLGIHREDAPKIAAKAVYGQN